MFKRLKEKLTDVIFGDLVQDWGTVFQRDAFFTETTDLALYRKPESWVVSLAYKYKSPISYNSFVFAIPVHDLNQFVTTLKSRYHMLRKSSMRKRHVTRHRRDRLPFFHRLIVRLIHGVKSSKLLLDHRDPKSNNTEYRFYGYVTRKSDIKVFIQSDMDISKSEGHIISGEGLNAALDALSGYLEKTQGVDLNGHVAF